MRNLVPQIVLHHWAQQRWEGTFQAVSVYVELSGVLQLSDTLLQHGTTGAALLSDVLNQLFDPLISEAHAHGAVVAHLAGDNIMLLFVGHAAAVYEHALHVACFAQQQLHARRLIANRYGVWTLSVRIGLAYGPIHWHILGADPQWTYCFHGQALTAALHAARRAITSETLVDPSLQPWLPPQLNGVSVDSYFKVTEPDWTVPAKRTRRRPQSSAMLTAFGLKDVLSLPPTLETRLMSSVCIAFEPPSDDTRLNSFVVKALSLARSYGGFCTKLDGSDQAWELQLAFGAPIAHPHALQHAADFLLAFKNAALDVAWRASCTYGSAHVGLVGNAEHAAYTLFGPSVKLASRLVEQATWGAIWANAAAYEGLLTNYSWEPIGPVMLRGQTTSVPVYQLLAQQAPDLAPAYADQLIDREAELTQLLAAIEPLWQGRSAGLIAIHGEVGLGKTRLLHELRQQLFRRQPLRWLAYPVEELVPESLSPFKQGLRTYFAQTADASPAENEQRFIHGLDMLLHRLAESSHPEAARLRQELSRTQSMLGAMLGLRWPDSLYEQLEPKLRFENMLAGFKALIQAESILQPVVLQLEDIHWLDADSHRLIRVLLRNIAEYPIAVICTSRYYEDGEKVVITLDASAPRHEIELTHFSMQGLAAFAAGILGGPASPEVITLLAEKTNGNPFFAEQLLLDLRERGMLQHTEGYHLVQGPSVEVPASINSVLIARLDRLMTDVKTIVQTAAVLGREFDIEVLKHMLPPDSEVMSKIKQAETEMIWSALGEIRYTFKHLLLRDAAIDMQIGPRLQALHQMAGAAFEQVYANDLAPYYTKLAYHYEQAEIAPKAIHYLRLAGERALRDSTFREAADFFARAVRLIPTYVPAPDELFAWQTQEATLRCQLGTAYRSLTLYAEAQSELEASLALATTTHDLKSRAEVYEQLGVLANTRGEHVQATAYYRQGVQFARASGDPATIIKLLTILGRESAFRLGEYEEAIACLNESRALAQAIDAPREIARALNVLGFIAYFQKQYHEAQQYFEQSLEMIHALSDRGLLTRSLTGLAMIAHMLQRFTEAVHFYQEVHAMAEEMGDGLNSTLALMNLSLSLIELGDFDTARNCLHQSLVMVQDMGSIFAMLAIIACSARLQLRTGNLEQALQCIGLVLNHPATSEDIRILASAILAEAERDHDPTMIAASLARGKTRSVDDLLAELLA